MKRYLPVFLLLFVLFTACEKVIQLVPDEQPVKLVVDGTIESGQPPVVFLTKSFGFFNQLTPGMLTDAFVRNATVTVSDGQRTVPLKEYPVPVGNGLFFVWSTDTTNPDNILLGKLNTSYTLAIDYEGVRYQAVTTIPGLNRTMDSLWWIPAPQNPDTNRVNVLARLTDPPGRGNYTRYYTARNDSAFVPGFNSVFDDAIVDGISYDVQVFRGQSRNAMFDRDEFGYFRLGDRVRVKLANIDKATYDFWRTWEQNQQNIGNPFGVPIKILGNINNGALGLWGGYGVQIKRLDIPR